MDQSAPSAAAGAARTSAVSAEATRCPICGTRLNVATPEARVGGGAGCANPLSTLREQQTSPFLDRSVMGGTGRGCPYCSWRARGSCGFERCACSTLFSARPGRDSSEVETDVPSLRRICWMTISMKAPFSITSSRCWSMTSWGTPGNRDSHCS